MLQQQSPTAQVFKLTQGRDETIQISITDSAGAALDLSGGATADFTLYERGKAAGDQLDYLTSAGGRIILLDGTGDGTNVQLKWTAAQSAAILANSFRAADVPLEGSLRILVSGLPTTVKRVFFELVQTKQGS